MSELQKVLDHAWQVQQSGDLATAESIYRQVLAQLPRNAAAHVYLGIALFDQRRFTESVESYRRAIAIQPEFPVAWNNLGNSLRMLGEIDEADRCLQTAIDQKPDYLSPLKNRGTLWIWAGEVERGLRWYHEALRLAPEDPELHRNLGVIYLLQERYAEGWPEYRWRWSFIDGGRPSYPFPIWQGENLVGKTVLLYPEQGLGDAIQFIRVASTLKSAGARTVVSCPASLIPLFQSAPGIDSLIPQGMSPVEPIDYQASFLDVVDQWFMHTGQLATGAGERALATGYLSVSESLVDYWRRTLGVGDGKKRIGICWQGNPKHHADIYRSIKLSEFAEIASNPAVSLISLQHGTGAEQIADVSFRDAIQRLPANIDQSGGAFLDTAAIMCNLDLVITTDTSTAHLAGALGVPVWVILGKVPDWRWLQHGETTPWYPSMRLFRQSRMGEWASVMSKINESLTAELQPASSKPPHQA
ncbi:MAG: tetratricopeptide repeat protein [Planctomycetaceae bacterium]